MRLSALVLLLVLLTALVSTPSRVCASPSAQVGIAVWVRVGPPALPVYEQPLCPSPGYMWAPGYWAYDDENGYFWVPGTWVLPPEVGLLWTPGYWGFEDGFYLWHVGYWGPEVGFYGGINYGFGYPGTGFYGGYWRGRDYYYNRNVTNINTTVVHNVYNTTVINNNTTVNRVSFNGGPGGVQARPTPAQTQATQHRRTAMTSEQQQFQQTARNDRNLFASVNHGRPEVAATSRANELSGRSGPNRAPTNNNNAAPRAPERPAPVPSRPNERPPSHQPQPASKPTPAPHHPDRPPEHQPARAPAPKPAPARPDERPQHAPPPTERPAPGHPQHQPQEHQPAPEPKQQPHPAPRPSHPSKPPEQQPRTQQ